MTASEESVMKRLQDLQRQQFDNVLFLSCSGCIAQYVVLCYELNCPRTQIISSEGWTTTKKGDP